ncbi:protein of unknown function [Shewanella benthica]|uniref:Uncharacterized protein n=1 Tax=Shewanella benthica TaxID=43661 RepID=A0A330M066_9GAMM|nr:protein of unknown function [Shewanella benthica]
MDVLVILAVLDTGYLTENNFGCLGYIGYRTSIANKAIHCF